MVKNLRIWLGGSFDPVHLGHLAILKHIANVLENYAKSHPNQPFNATLSLLPTARNPLKPHPTDNNHRLKMLELGLKDVCPHPCPLPQGEGAFSSLREGLGEGKNINFQIDTSEIFQTDTVFTFHTFTHFRQLYPDDSLIFMLGKDSILGFDKWYKGFELPNLCHLWVMPREGNFVTEKLPTALKSRVTNNLADLINTPNGRIYLDTHQVPSISSSQIRAELVNLSNFDGVKAWLAPSVLDYILQNRLYQF